MPELVIVSHSQTLARKGESGMPPKLEWAICAFGILHYVSTRGLIALHCGASMGELCGALVLHVLVSHKQFFNALQNELTPSKGCH